MQKLLPFSLLGLDTDNGSEFINYELLRFCQDRHITFTRSRAYRKNDQAHVEEKNGSIVRRLIGYNRYEGGDAWKALAELYATLRLYTNFFQPSMKLLSKQRWGAKIKKTYDKAQTPYQRLLVSSHSSEETKANLKIQYESLDPLHLLQDLKRLQSQFLQHAWKGQSKELFKNAVNINQNLTDHNKQSLITNQKQSAEKRSFLQHYCRTPKPRKPLMPRTWQTHKDVFETVWGRLKLRLQIDPHCTAKSLLMELIQEDPLQFKLKQLRTLQRRVAGWRMAEPEYAGLVSKQTAIGRGNCFLSLATVAAK